MSEGKEGKSDDVRNDNEGKVDGGGSGGGGGGGGGGGPKPGKLKFKPPNLDALKRRLEKKLMSKSQQMARRNPNLAQHLASRTSGDILRRLYPFYMSKTGQAMQRFFEEHAWQFDPDEEENKLVYTEIYKEYEAAMEGFLAEFLDEQGISPADFYDAISRQAEQGADKQAQVMMKMINAQSDFVFFVQLMRDKSRDARKSAREAKAQG